ncbi:MAG TPA: SDR family NAD(P)-dependent oxidoreductase [Terriglobia bacterium]|nr:SDR family NAD(P)-dependent oxidoreductase [Terriglobia bacterium]
MDFDGRVAVVTGGTGALGCAVVRDLLESGARVVVPYTREEGWKALQMHVAEQADRLTGSSVDLADAGQVDNFIQDTLSRTSRVDFLVSLAGGFAAGKSFESDERIWDRMLDMNLRSVFLLLQPVVPAMIRQNFGRIITVSSGAILGGGGIGMAAYAVTKGAVRQLTDILAKELAGYDIRAHCVMPGTMDTESNRKAMPKANPAEWVKTEDVARVIHFLLGDQSRAVRSAVVPVLG